MLLAAHACGNLLASVEGLPCAPGHCSLRIAVKHGSSCVSDAKQESERDSFHALISLLFH